jgi:ADP-ribose pyrophosphatase YjhB (NUDIX family)
MEKKCLNLAPYTIDNIHPGFSVDCVILSFYKKKIQVLLSKFDVSDLWQLPGGFMLKEESADEAAYRVLRMRTGLTDVYLRQFHLFSDPNRTKMDQNKILSLAGLGAIWLMQRFVSLGYYALVGYDRVELVKAEGETAGWFDMANLPKLYSDHECIISKAKEMIRYLLPILPVGYELLPEKFTLSELRKIYEIITEKTLDRRNFQRKVLSTGVLKQLDETKTANTYNPASLYSFEEGKKDSIDYDFFL